MKPMEQLEKWVNGISIHNDERDECCPDFSCCNKEVNTPMHIRKIFKGAVESKNEDLKMKMLMGFLGGVISTLKTDKKVYVAGKVDIDENIKSN